MSTTTTPTNPKAQGWRAKSWPVGITLFLTAVVAFNLAMVTISLKVAPEVVADDYYAQGFDLKQILEQEKASAGLGWAVTVIPASNQTVMLSVRDAAGLPVDSLLGDVTFYRPSERALDIPARPLRAAGGGTYSLTIPRNLETGSWQALVSMNRASQKFRQRIPFSVDAQ